MHDLGLPPFKKGKDKPNDRYYIRESEVGTMAFRIKADTVVVACVKTKNDADKILKDLQLD